jgi:hypothetical protein
MFGMLGMVFGMLGMFFMLVVFALGAILWMGYCGFTPQWLLRSKDHRRIGKLLRGALAMGPEGWEPRSWGTVSMWTTRAGSISLEAPITANDYYDLEKVRFTVGGQRVPLEYRRDCVVAVKKLREWDNSRRKLIEREKLRGIVDDLESHIVANISAYDALDARVVKARQLGRASIGQGL